MTQSLELICLGVESYAHPVLTPYLLREIGKLGRRIASIQRLHTLDPEIPIRLRQLLEEGSGPCLIAADRDHFPLVGRILATLKGEAMILSETGTLIPADAREARRDSYLFRFGERLINVIRVEPGRKLPELLLDPESRKTWQIFPETPEELEALRRLELEIADSLDLTEILPGWIRVTSYRSTSPTSLTSERLRQVTPRIIPGDSLVEFLIGYLAAVGKHITFAESCTGGLLAATFTSQPGASDILEGSYVTYANRIKSGWLGVREETLREYGAVSRECVLEMAAGAQRNLPADIAIAVSGIAGPTGAVPGKPVGTVYLCLRNGDSVRTERLQLHGDRNAVQKQTVLYALKFLVESEKEKIFKFFSENS